MEERSKQLDVAATHALEAPLKGTVEAGEPTSLAAVFQPMMLPLQE
jgi:hypothetical protein